MLSNYLVRNKQSWAVTRKIVKNSWSANITLIIKIK